MKQPRGRAVYWAVYGFVRVPFLLHVHINYTVASLVNCKILHVALISFTVTVYSNFVLAGQDLCTSLQGYLWQMPNK